jgi:perosamine synthetase
MTARRTIPLLIPYIPPGAIEGVLDKDPTSACWLCTALVDRRDDFQQKLAAEGIESDPIHFRNDRFSVFGASQGSFPNMDAVDSKYLALPLHMGIDAADVERVCAVIRSGW